MITQEHIFAHRQDHQAHLLLRFGMLLIVNQKIQMSEKTSQNAPINRRRGTSGTWKYRKFFLQEGIVDYKPRQIAGAFVILSGAGEGWILG